MTVGEATFVDDECLMLCARSPAALNSKIDQLLHLLICEFSAHGFKINFAKGKTEAIIVYRGKGSKVASDNLWRRDLASGQMNHVYPLSQRVDGIEFIHVVTSYKHVGSIISSDLCWSQDSHLKYANAIAAYAPTARDQDRARIQFGVFKIVV